MSDKEPDANVATIKAQRQAFYIIVAAFALGAGLAIALEIGAFYLISIYVKEAAQLQTVKEILLIITPVFTLVIGSIFGFIAGKKA